MNLYSQITNTQIEYTFALSLLCRLLYVMLHEKHIQLSGLCGSWSSSYVLVYHPVFQTKFRRSSRSSSGGLCTLETCREEPPCGSTGVRSAKATMNDTCSSTQAPEIPLVGDIAHLGVGSILSSKKCRELLLRLGLSCPS
jgi:hypothetical protein